MVPFTGRWLLTNLLICCGLLLAVAFVGSAGTARGDTVAGYAVETLQMTVATALYGCVMPVGGLALWGYGLLVVSLFDRTGPTRPRRVRLALFLGPTLLGAIAAIGGEVGAAVLVAISAAAYAVCFRLWPKQVQSAPSI